MQRKLDGLKFAVLVGGGLLALFFGGQVFQLAARWTARAISGAVLILTALVVAYATYQIYTGWSAAGDESSADTEDRPATTDTEDPGSVDGLEQEYLDGELSESEFEQELESVLEESDETDRLTETER